MSEEQQPYAADPVADQSAAPAPISPLRVEISGGIEHCDADCQATHGGGPRPMAMLRFERPATGEAFQAQLNLVEMEVFVQAATKLLWKLRAAVADDERLRERRN